jgi:phenylacetic acid degradation operon negative regulatory protein
VSEARPGRPPELGIDDLQLRPLTARSVILSVLLGSHPPLLPVRAVVRTGELFGISEGTTRVALSRLAADGDVVADQGHYCLSDRLVARQRRLDEGLVPATRPWRGGWEVGVLASDARSQADRAAVRAQLEALRLAELRPGVWIRPANLRRPWPASLDGQAWRFDAHPYDAEPHQAHPHQNGKASRELVDALWNVEDWARRAETLLAAFKNSDEPPRRFVIAAAVLRHLQADPLLPPGLLPPRWPGRRLRAAYDGYVAELQSMLQQEWIRGRRGP